MEDFLEKGRVVSENGSQRLSERTAHIEEPDVHDEYCILVFTVTAVVSFAAPSHLIFLNQILVEPNADDALTQENIAGNFAVFLTGISQLQTWLTASANYGVIWFLAKIFFYSTSGMIVCMMAPDTVKSYLIISVFVTAFLIFSFSLRLLVFFDFVIWTITIVFGILFISLFPSAGEGKSKLAMSTHAVLEALATRVVLILYGFVGPLDQCSNSPTEVLTVTRTHTTTKITEGPATVTETVIQVLSWMTNTP